MAFFEADLTLFLFEKELHCSHPYKLLLSFFQKNKTNNNIITKKRQVSH